MLQKLCFDLEDPNISFGRKRVHIHNKNNIIVKPILF